MIALNSLRNPFESLITGLDIFIFSALFLLLNVLKYYNRGFERIKLTDKTHLTNPIYQSKDILLQSKTIDANFLIVEKTTSIWVKSLLFLLIVFVVITPLYQLFGVEHFV